MRSESYCASSVYNPHDWRTPCALTAFSLPFALFQVALAASILMDHHARPAFPRWSAFLFSSFFMCEASLLPFVKTGPFSQNGVLAFYVPMIVFFTWIVVFTMLTVRAATPTPPDDSRRQTCLRGRVPARRAADLSPTSG